MYSSKVEMELFANTEQIGTHEIWRGRNLLRKSPVITVNGQMRSAKYVSWEINNYRRVPTGYYIRSGCEFKTCINPDHLELVRKEEGENVEESREEDRNQQLSAMQSIGSQLGAS
jgi:hypothetical protein